MEKITLECTECSREFHSAEGYDQNLDYVGSVRCPVCGAIIDTDIYSFIEYCDLAMIEKTDQEYIEFCERNL